MADQYVQINPDSTGKKVDVSELTVNSNTVERQRVVIGDNATAGNYAAITSAGAVTVLDADIAASGSVVTQNLNPTSGTATAGSTVATATLNSDSTAAIQVTGSYTGALTAQGSVDGSNWVALSGLVNANTGVVSSTIASAATGIWQVDVSGFQLFRVTALAAVTGTAVVTVRVSSTQATVSIDAPLPAGTNLLGSVQLSGNTTSWTASATGGSTAFTANAIYHTVATAGTATACTLRLEGSLDNSNWFDVSGTFTATAATMFHVDQKPLTYVRVNVLTFTGTSITIFYRGN